MEFKYEVVKPNDDLPFRMFIFEGWAGNYKVVKHWHRSVEIFLVLEGHIDFQINSREYKLQEREFIIVNSNEVHSIDAPDKNKTIVLQIPLQLFQKHLVSGNYILFENNNKEHDPKIVSVMNLMYQIYEEKDEGYELMVQSQFFLLLYLLVSKYKIEEVDDEILRTNKNLNRLSSITTYIRDNYTKEISLENLAEVFGYSPAYLSRMFQKYGKVNFKQFLQNIRVEYAYKDLVNTDYTIAQISAQHGFPNSKSFSKAFCRRYGMMPNAYRKELNK